MICTVPLTKRHNKWQHDTSNNTGPTIWVAQVARWSFNHGTLKKAMVCWWSPSVTIGIVWRHAWLTIALMGPLNHIINPFVNNYWLFLEGWPLDPQLTLAWCQSLGNLSTSTVTRSSQPTTYGAGNPRRPPSATVILWWLDNGYLSRMDGQPRRGKRRMVLSTPLKMMLVNQASIPKWLSMCMVVPPWPIPRWSSLILTPPIEGYTVNMDKPTCKTIFQTWGTATTKHPKMFETINYRVVLSRLSCLSN